MVAKAVKNSTANGRGFRTIIRGSSHADEFKRRGRSRRYGVRTASSGMGCHACISPTFSMWPVITPCFRESWRSFFCTTTTIKKSQFERKKAVSNNFYLAPGPGYGVFVRAHIGHRTCIFFCSVQSRLKITSQRPVGLCLGCRVLRVSCSLTLPGPFAFARRALLLPSIRAQLQ